MIFMITTVNIVNMIWPLTSDSTYNPVSRLCAEADLRIGELQWGDSGVYFCKVVIADDLEGKNEAQLELLVLGMPTLHFPIKVITWRLWEPDREQLARLWVWFHVKLTEVSFYMLVKVLETVSLPLCVPRCLYDSFHGDEQMVFASLRDLDNGSLHRVNVD